MFLDAFPYIWTLVFCVFGTVLLFTGLPWYKFTLFVWGIGNTVMTVTMVAYFLFLPYDTPLWVGWVLVLSGSVVGLVVG